jgi:hypothetical protein
MADDRVAAALNRIRVRAGIAHSLIADDVRRSQRDVPPLLAAVEAVLALHPLTGYVWRVEPCIQHLSFDTTPSEHRACPDCVVIHRDGCCARCRDEEGDPARPEDCKERAAILAALSGEEASP